MKKRVIGLILCLVTVGVLGVIGVWRSRSAAGTTRCLLIGCDRFVSMPSTEPAGANNVDTMAALLRDFLPEGSSIIRQVNGPGTVAGFEQMATDAFRRAKNEDVSLIYLSTHGILIKNEQLRMKNDPLRRGGSFDFAQDDIIHNSELETEEEPGVRENGNGMALLLSDGTEEEYLTPGKLREILDKIPGEKILILDACHSGAVIGREEGENYFEGSGCRVLVSSGAEEESWFWNSETDAYTGTGYFTAAMDCALRASDPEQIDPDGNGQVSLEELTERLREIHGASTVYCFPEESGEKLFDLPKDRKTGSRLQGVAFGEPEQDGDGVTLPIRFRAGEKVRVMYQLVARRNGKWDFEHAVRLPDKERTGLVRGLVSPGEKDRKIRLTIQSLGEDGRALLQIICYYGNSMTPSIEAGKEIIIHN